MLFCIVFSSNACRKKEASQTAAEKVAHNEKKALELDTVIMAVGEAEITYQEVLFYMYEVKANYEQGLTSDLWNYNIGENETIGTYAKDKIIEEITQVKIICAQAAKQGYELTEEERNEAAVQADAYVTRLSKEDQETYHLTKELVEKIYIEHALAEKTYNIVAGEVDTMISDADAKQISIAGITIITNGEDRNGIAIQMTPEEKEAAGKRAKSLLKEAKKSENFVIFAENNSDDSKVERTFGREDGPTDYVNEAFALKTGEMSGVIEKQNAYYILYCINDYDEESTLKRKEELIKEREIKAFQEAYEKWSAAYKTVVSTTLWDKIMFQ